MSRREEIAGQEAMFEVPPVYRRPRHAPQSDSWQSYKGRSISCDICVLDLHEGTPDGPMDKARTRLVRTRGDVWLLCDRHASSIKNGGRRLPETRR